MTDPEIEDLAADLNPDQRRGMATKLELWVWELRNSADLIEKAGLSLETVPEPDCFDGVLPEFTKDLTRSELLELSSVLTAQVDRILRALDVAKSEIHPAKMPLSAAQN